MTTWHERGVYIVAWLGGSYFAAATAQQNYWLATIVIVVFAFAATIVSIFADHYEPLEKAKSHV